MEIFTGRPSDVSDRLTREINTYDFLDSLGIEYLRIDHARADTMEACAEIDAALGTAICKNLFLCNRQKTNFYLLLMPGDKPFKTKDLSAELCISRLSFAGAEDMEKYLGLFPGSVSIMGLLNDKDLQVRLVIDKAVLEEEYFACHPCENTSSIKLKTSDLTDKIIPALKHDLTVVEL